MSENEVRKKLVEVISNDIDSFERFKTKAEGEIPNLPENLQTAAKAAINDEEFSKEYLRLIGAYKEIAKNPEVKISSGVDLYSEDAVEKVAQNLQTRGLKIDYKRKRKDDEKEFHLSMDSSFLKALGALISRIAGLF